VSALQCDQISTFTGHADRLVSVEFSPDEKTLATSSRDRTIKLWNLDTMQEVLTLTSEEVLL
jgi:WD40 repeat protein